MAYISIKSQIRWIQIWYLYLARYAQAKIFLMFTTLYETILNNPIIKFSSNINQIVKRYE